MDRVARERRAVRRGIGNNEKEGREGTTLLDSPLNGNKTRGRTTEERGHFDVMKGTANEVAQPDGELGFLQDLENPPMVNGIEGLGGIEQENVPLGVGGNPLIEELVEVLRVGVAVNAGKEAPLGRIEEGGNSRHSASHGTSQETVVSVGDADRAGVGDQTGLLLG